LIGARDSNKRLLPHPVRIRSGQGGWHPESTAEGVMTGHGLAIAILTAIGCLGLVASPRTDDGRAGVHVGPNVQVSAGRADVPHAEVILAADPADHKRLLAGSMLRYSEGEDQCIGYRSTDGGKTWTIVLEPGGQAQTRGVKRAADPAVTFGPDGAAYYVMLAAEARLKYHHAVVYRSADGGKTWSDPVHVHQPTRIDRPYVAVDLTGGKSRGRVYCNAVVVTDSLAGTGGTSADGLPQTGVGLFYSADGGKSFSEPVPQRVRMANLPHGARGANGCVLSDGTVVALYDVVEDWRDRAGSPHLLAVERSVDGGRSFEPASPSVGERPPRDRAVPRDKLVGRTELKVGSGVARGIPYLAVDGTKGPHRDRLYAVWEAFDGTRSRVMFSASADKGLKWSDPGPVSDGADAGAAGNYRGASMPSVAVNKDGVVGVSWYDTRDAMGADPGWDLRFCASLDGGKTWGTSIRVSEKSSALTEAMRKRLGRVWRGDTAGLAASADGRFHALWIDTRTGTPQAWTAAITIGGKP
jgi:hypothetical protein